MIPRGLIGIPPYPQVFSLVSIHKGTSINNRSTRPFCRSMLTASPKSARRVLRVHRDCLYLNRQIRGTMEDVPRWFDSGEQHIVLPTVKRRAAPPRGLRARKWPSALTAESPVPSAVGALNLLSSRQACACQRTCLPESFTSRQPTRERGRLGFPAEAASMFWSSG